MLISSKPIHIVSIASYPIFPAKMGGQKGIASFYAYFSGKLPVTLISTVNNGEPEGFKGEFLPIMSDKASRYFNPFFFFKLRKVLLERKATHLILEHPYLGWLGILVKWLLGTKLIVHSHNIEALRFKSVHKWWWRLLWQYEKRVHRLADFSFWISDEDRAYAIENFGLKPELCQTITYGFERAEPPSSQEKKQARTLIEKELGLPSGDTLLFFNGTLDYKPNLDAVQIILNEINPMLLQHPDFKYKIIICGKNLPSSLDQLKAYADKNIIYAGFVSDINTYFNGVDIFINPVVDGGGIKTKLVEALGFNLQCISTHEGAIGVPENITNGKLQIIHEHNWTAFASAIVKAQPNACQITSAYFDHFYWDKIAEKASNVIGKL